MKQTGIKQLHFKDNPLKHESCNTCRILQICAYILHAAHDLVLTYVYEFFN